MLVVGRSVGPAGARISAPETGGLRRRCRPAGSDLSLSGATSATEFLRLESRRHLLLDLELHDLLPPSRYQHYHGIIIIMLQSDLLDTLFLNRKALADVGGVGSGTAGKNTTESKATTTTTTTIKMKSETPPAGVSSGSETCPVDHKSREVWMAQARAAQQAQETGVTQSPRPPTQASQPTSTSSSWGWRIPFFGASSSSSTQTQQSLPQTSPHSPPSLPDSRVVSTIPRSSTPGATPNAATTNTACPVNHETETGADPKTGNWVYPSEKMFFEAMKRKGHDTRAADMKTVVPIHNAVNERAWAEIKRWEAPYGKST